MTSRYKEALGRSSFGTQEVRQMRAKVSNEQTAEMARKLAQKRTTTSKKGKFVRLPPKTE